MPPVPRLVDDPEWRSLDFDDLQTSLSAQRANSGRIRVPTWEEVLKVLPTGYPLPEETDPNSVEPGLHGLSARAGGGLVGLHHVPSGEESKQDKVFEESLFWVVTRTIHCFY